MIRNPILKKPRKTCKKQHTDTEISRNCKEIRLSPAPITTTLSRDTEPLVVRPLSPKPHLNDSIKSELSDSEPKVKRLKPSTAITSSGNLSSESSGSDSDSSNDSSDSDNDKNFLPVKEESQLDIGGSGMSGMLITPLGQPNVKDEEGASGDAIMNMLHQDLDISSDSESD